VNPRWVLWLRSRGETPETMQRDDDGLVVDPVDCAKRPAACVFMLWMQDAWRRWATELGFVGSYPHETALLSGHTADEFDVWLEGQVG
jgi:hypothetical protein